LLKNYLESGIDSGQNSNRVLPLSPELSTTT